jgi:hypothetical protein
MAQPRNLAEQFEGQPEAEPTPVDAIDIIVAPPDEIDRLRALVATMALRIATLEAPPPEIWLSLKAAASDCAMNYETLRSWAIDGLITARREGDGGRLFVDVVSVKARQRRLGTRK